MVVKTAIRVLKIFFFIDSVLCFSKKSPPLLWQESLGVLGFRAFACAGLGCIAKMGGWCFVWVLGVCVFLGFQVIGFALVWCYKGWAL